MNLFIIENDATVDQVLAMPAYDPREDHIVCFNYLPYDKLLSRTDGRNVHFVEEFLSGEDYTDLHRATDDFARRWYMVDGKDATLFNGVSFGDVTQIMLSRTYLLTVLVKYGEVVRKLAELYPSAKSIYHDLSNSSNSFFYYRDDRGKYFDKEGLIRSVALQLKIDEHYIRPSEPIPPVFLASMESVMKEPGGVFRNMVNCLGLFVMRSKRIINRFVGNRRRSTYFFNYFNIASILESTNSNYIFAAPITRKATTLFRCVDFRTISRETSEEEETFIGNLRKTFLESGRDMYDNKFIFRSIDYSGFYARVVEDIVLRYIPMLLKYYHQVKKAIKELDIEKMILIDVMTEKGRTLVEACKRTDCKSIFVDHGIMGYRFAQDSSRGFAPDLIIKPDDFATNGDGYPYMIKSDSIQLGNPSMDPYTLGRRKKIVSIKTVLLHTFSDNFYARLNRFAYQEAYFKELLTAIPYIHEMGINILYRPHSENPKYHDHLFKYFNIDQRMITMSDFSKPFRELIYEVDLLVCNVSNTFYESLGAGTPVIFLEPCFDADCFFPPLNGTNWEQVIRASTAREVVDIIRRNKEDPEELNHFMDSFLRDYSKKFFYELDGLAGKRIVEYLNRR